MPYDPNINHAPKRKEILNHEERKLALRNALRYFPKQLHAQLAPEFIAELDTYGRIYMYRYRPTYDMYARPIDEYPHRSEQAAAIMLMIQNNLNPEVDSASARTNRVRRQRCHLPELGAVPITNEIP